MIVCNGEILAQAEQFDVRDVQVIAATVDLDDVRSYRASLPSFGIQAASYAQNTPRRCIPCPDVKLTMLDLAVTSPTMPTTLKYHSPEEECCLGPACWLWDYLRRSGATGFFLPLSGAFVLIHWIVMHYLLLITWRFLSWSFLSSFRRCGLVVSGNNRRGHVHGK
jgi:NAD+ synthase (glutamine-hydrolysing)